MRVGVTGAAGTLGRRVVEAFHQDGVGVKPFDGDVRDVAAVERWTSGLDAVVHCAAVTPTRDVSAYLADAIAINVAGTANVARAVAAAGAKLTYISSSHVYRSSQTPVDETAALGAISLYGLTKLQGEQWALQSCQDTLILRVFSFFDARQAQSFLVPALMARIETAPLGARLDLHGARSRRDIADATWLGAACARLVRAGATGVVNCAAGRRDSILDIAESVARSLDRPDVVWNVVDGGPPDFLLADTKRLDDLIADLPAFNLPEALSRMSVDRAPRPADALRKRLT